MSFPTSVTTFAVSAGTETLGLMGSGVGLSGMVNVLGTELNAVETKLGTGSSTAAANQILVGTGSGVSAWQGLTSSQLASIVSDETGSGSLVFGNSPTIVTPTIASFANANHDHSNSAGGGVLTYTGLPTGAAIQFVSGLTTAVATGTTVIPNDDTIPQNTEGDQYMSLAITPKLNTSTLVIDCLVDAANNASNDIIGALFQDSTANALAATEVYQVTANGGVILRILHTMTSATTSATTFKVRVGGSAAGTTTFNGGSATRRFGAITKSVMMITEYKA